MTTARQEGSATNAACAPQTTDRQSRARPLSATQQWLAFCLYRVPLVHTIVAKLLYQAQFALLRFYHDPQTVRLIRSVYRETTCLVQPLEAHLIYSLARMQSNLEGCMAEVGTYQGATAKLICHAKQGRVFYGFDTFAGLPEPGHRDTSHGQRFFRAGKYAAPYEGVKTLLSTFDDVHLVKGMFPATSQCIDGLEFSFVHLDIDLYQGTREALDVFWPRMVDRGIIAVHDSHAGGVAQAIREFTAAESPLSFRSFGSHVILIKHAGRPARRAHAALHDAP